MSLRRSHKVMICLPRLSLRRGRAGFFLGLILLVIALGRVAAAAVVVFAVVRTAQSADNDAADAYKLSETLFLDGESPRKHLPSPIFSKILFRKVLGSMQSPSILLIPSEICSWLVQMQPIRFSPPSLPHSTR